MNSASRFVRFAAIALVGSLAPAARAQALLSFTGGSGAPLTLNLLSPVTYTITTNSNGVGPGFVFQNLGNLFNSNAQVVTGTITYSVNGGAAQTIDRIKSGFAGGAVAATDTFIYGISSSVSVGDTVTLQSGTLTTTGNAAATAPSAGSYNTFLFDGTNADISGPGLSAAPEPGSITLLSLLALPNLGLIRRRK